MYYCFYVFILILLVIDYQFFFHVFVIDFGALFIMSIVGIMFMMSEVMNYSTLIVIDIIVSITFKFLSF